MDDPLWATPYLETCCRSALHRLWLSAGRRPFVSKDAACLRRLALMGLTVSDADGYALTPAGRERHAAEVQRAPDPLNRHAAGRN